MPSTSSAFQLSKCIYIHLEYKSLALSWSWLQAEVKASEGIFIMTLFWVPLGPGPTRTCRLWTLALMVLSSVRSQEITAGGMKTAQARCLRSRGRQAEPELRGGSGRQVSCGRWDLIHPPKDGQDLHKHRQGGGNSLLRQWHDLKLGERQWGDALDQSASILVGIKIDPIKQNIFKW